ncbi:hypothetical protein NP095_08975 [Aeromicrobium duanguangcaii]|uniref:DUF2157 domain-containing protein n=1 Tax=Aeromicrobium duanguangcaii TaxID=2968086 RepID=A0ABY5KG22_9ACTN|nr:hypothetical protein [Aeromicrobium duanguangcaii]UUI67343.1 hypothetical protein NP095_08975 [Aeromicrobium duanguangcaii]
MKYADPHACPACRGAISGGISCPHCAFDLTSREAQQLWGLFVQADGLVEHGRALQSRAPRPDPEPRPAVAAAATNATSAAPANPVAPGAYRPAVPTAAQHSWSTGSILLGLGAVCLVVAGIIFTTVAWGVLGILGRALILLVVTAIAGACAWWATRRRLFGTAESLWSVFLGLITVDVLAAVGQGLFGLEWGDFAVVSLVWTAGVVGTAVALVRWARAEFGHELVMPQIAAGLAPWVSAPALMDRLIDLGDQDTWFWSAVAALAVPLVVTVLGVRLRMPWATWGAGFLTLCLGVFAVVLAVIHAQSGSPVLTFGEALPTFTLIVAALVGGVLVLALRPWLVGAATVGLLFLVGVAASGWAWRADVPGSIAVVAVVVAVLAVAVVRPDAWSLGVRWGTLVTGSALLLWAGAVALMNLERIDVADRYLTPADVWARPVDISVREDWKVLAVVAALLVVWWAMGRWPAPRFVPDELRLPVALVAGGAGIVTAVASSSLPFLVHAIALVVVGAALAFGLRRAPAWFAVVPPVVVAMAAVVVPGDSSVTAWTWGLVAAGFGLCALAGFDDPVETRRGTSAVSLGLATAAVIATIGLVLNLSDTDPGWWSTIIAGCAAAALLLALALDELPWHRIAVEVVAAFALVVAVVSADGLATVALLFTIGAVAAAVVGLLDDDRTYLRWVAAGLVGGAWVTRLAASEVGTVEAYTAPFAVAVLAAGVWRLREDSGSRTWSVLVPGLTLALLPSLPQALADPTSVRAGLLALVAAGFLAAGVMLRWGAPVVAGSAVVLVLVLANVGPTALALQRWILIAIAGLVLLVVGTTWEKRVAEGRALVARLAALR